MARFPWPDAPAASQISPDIRASLNLTAQASLGDALASLKRKLHKDYKHPQLLNAGCEGFAMILQSERITSQGRRVGFARHGQAAAIKTTDLLRLWLDELHNAQPGLYRILVVVAAREHPSLSLQPATEAQLHGFIAQGSSSLPAGFAKRPFTDDFRVHVLVYEFEVVKLASKAKRAVLQLPQPGRVSLANHGRHSGLPL